MEVIPNLENFINVYATGVNHLVYTRLAADLDTPVSLMLKLTQAQKNSFMLESVTGGDVKGRYSIIGMNPDLIWRCDGKTASINRSALNNSETFIEQSEDPLTSLRIVLGETAIDLPHDLPPMAAGLFGYLGYDMIRLVEHLPNINPDKLDLPDAIMMRPSVIIIVDGVKDELTIVSPVWNTGKQDAKFEYSKAKKRVSNALMDLNRPLSRNTQLNADQKIGEPVSNVSKDQYLKMVENAKTYIKSGDIFQVVPSQRWTLDFPLPPFSLYRALRRTNPSPYMFFFNFGEFQVTGASPEILVRVKGDEVTIRPIAGTRPRGKTPEQDKALELDLLADKKELAEHLMLLDLGRNDVGRVAKIGTINPNEKFIIERYSHVMHIVSNVIGTLSADNDALSALLAGLPAGTVSGAPKVRAMEVIDELEIEKRGVYGGGVGYFSSNGDMDICIALRTAVTKSDKLYIQAGGGVVYDSDPESEFQETISKSKALHAAAKMASQYSN